MTFNPAQLIERDDRWKCSVPCCKKESAITYLPGATPANPKKWISLCDSHHIDFCKMPEASRHPLKNTPSPDTTDPKDN